MKTTMMAEFNRQLNQLARDGICESTKEIAREYLRIPFVDFLKKERIIREEIKKAQEKNGGIHLYEINETEGILPILFVAPELDLERLIKNKKRGFLEFEKPLIQEKTTWAYIIFDIKRNRKNKIFVFFTAVFGDRRTLNEKELVFLNYYYRTSFQKGELTCRKKNNV